MCDDEDLQLSDREIAACFNDPASATRFPPVLNIQQAGDLLGVPVGTLRDWRSRGLLANCARRVGREVKFFRDRLLKQVFNCGLYAKSKDGHEQKRNETI